MITPKKFLLFSVAAAIITIFLTTLWLLFGTPTIIAQTPEENNSNTPLKSAVEVTLSHPIARQAVEVSVTPEIAGQLIFSNSMISNHLYRTIRFIPERALDPNANYTVHISNIKSQYGQKSISHSINFATQSIPKISSTNPGNNQEINICDPIEVTLNQPNDGIVTYNFHFTPETAFDTTLSNDKTKYLVKPKECLVQGAKYRLVAEKIIIFHDNNTTEQSNPAIELDLAFSTKAPPNIEDYSPKGNQVIPDQKEIKITFREPMDQADVLSKIRINPTPSGSWKWLDPKNLVYTLNDKLAWDTRYNLTIPMGTKAANGGSFSEDVNLTFTTIGHVLVLSIYPNNTSGVAESTLISITFNQAVDHQSAENAFSINPSVAGSFQWSGSQMTFSPNNALAKNTRYEIRINSGIKSINGLDSTQSYQASFQTENSSTILNIKLDYQDKPLSCEVASLKMALVYKGVNASENDLMAIIGFDPTPHSNGIWGNPHQAFVGDINGKQNSTGYGVYWEPIAKAANHYRSATATTGMSASGLAQEIANGNPVVIWGTIGSAYRDDWTTKDGVHITAWRGEHTRTVIGFRGSIENPTQFILNDPVAGRITWSTSTLLGNWSSFGNAAVIVY